MKKEKIYGLFVCIVLSITVALVLWIVSTITPSTSAIYEDEVQTIESTTASTDYEIEEETIPVTTSIEETTECAPIVTEEPETEELEAPEEKITPAYNYTQEELDLLARLIYSEGGIESYETQLKIGSVVMNRVNDPRFPNTIREVIYQTNQFSVTFTRINGVLMIDRPASEQAKQAALEVLTYGSVLPPEVQVFYEKSITTGWVASREPYGTFDHTTFAYIYSRG